MTTKIIEVGHYFHMREGLQIKLVLKGNDVAFNAIEDKVILKIDQVEEVTESGLYIPDTATAMPETGTVVAVGPGRVAANGKLIPTGINVGDKVLFQRRAAQRVEIEGEDYLIFLSEHILAIVED
jgi:chaperonin GroES